MAEMGVATQFMHFWICILYVVKHVLEGCHRLLEQPEISVHHHIQQNQTPSQASKKKN